jgi:hypothetical protein
MSILETCRRAVKKGSIGIYGKRNKRHLLAWPLFFPLDPVLDAKMIHALAAGERPLYGTLHSSPTKTTGKEE